MNHQNWNKDYYGMGGTVVAVVVVSMSYYA